MRPLAYLQTGLPALLRDMEALISLESPSRHLPGLAAVADWIETRFSALGPVERTETSNGPLLKARVAGRGRRVLVLCHYDTVHPVGSFPRVWRVEGERAYGPGVYDMKGNIVQLLWALHTLRRLGLAWPELTLLFTPDEEIGSQASRPFIEAEARQSEAVLVLEAPMPNGDLKVARKGVGLYRITARGRPAHQGVEPEKGVNAILELAHQIPRIVALEDAKEGTTLGPNRIQGGTATNVVAAEAWVEVDLRVWTMGEAQRVEQALKALQPVLPGASLQVEGGLNRPPMEPSPASLELFEMARRVGQELGLELGAGRVGGGSDGNFTAALGVPTLDGLGLFGEAAHQPSENVYIPQIPGRTALLCGILEELAR
ncbi:M20 family peptidase [Meiothermus sp. QL-1]|uniref:M20 family metallopeptidase n=1 Tax=Meiothermus sp. QL-1 TaxID=2058095 RepID=UPI000E0C4E06|nr:M20 family metallopeptidase [Meiothermus sp. QL-1]RDI95972.1 M20 family peptidase [Meiothermus sp. QL-1]